MKLLPNTRPGKWALWLSDSALAVLLLLNLLPDTFSFLPDGIKVALFTLCLACFIAAAVLGLAAVLRSRERAAFVYLAILLGLAVLVFLLIRVFSVIIGG